MSGPDFDAIAEAVSPEQLAQAIGAQPSSSPGSFHCPSPAHENGDKSPSLSIGRKDGRTVLYCHSCQLSGTPVQVAGTIWGMTANDAAERLIHEIGIIIPETAGPAGARGNGLGELVHTYDYHTEEGNYSSSVRRYAHPKGFRQGRRSTAGPEAARSPASLRTTRRAPRRGLLTVTRISRIPSPSKSLQMGAIPSTTSPPGNRVVQTISTGGFVLTRVTLCASILSPNTP